VDKPEGPTSHDAVDAVRRAFGIRRVGHAGTLDPFASGLLVVLLGAATRLARFMAPFDKTYLGTIQLGITTDTDDGTGTTVRSSDAWQTVSDEQIADAMRGLTGDYAQRPPAFSAKKVQGQRAYRLARAGRDVALPSAAVRVHEFVCVRRHQSALEFETRVGTGTYVRALARDLGERLGCGAHLAVLRRTEVGPFAIADAVPLAEVEPDARSRVRPALRAVAHLPQLQLADDQRKRVIHGQPLEVSRPEGSPVALVSDAELVAVAEREGSVLKPRVVVTDA
jgi:tRNA pseudouridine55 synthase